MAKGWLSRYSNPEQVVKRTPIEKVKAFGLPVFFMGCAGVATVWFWQHFVFNDPVKDNQKEFFSPTTSQDTLDKLKKINSDAKR